MFNSSLDFGLLSAGNLIVYHEGQFKYKNTIIIIIAILSVIVFIAMLYGNSTNSANTTSNMIGGMPDIPCNCNKNH